MSKEKQCECCHEWWYASVIKEDLCPNCYDYFKQLKQQLEEKDKEIECWKDKTKNKILNMKTTDFVKMCLSCGLMLDITEQQKRIAELEQELAGLKENAIVPKFNVGQEVWHFITGKPIKDIIARNDLFQYELSALKFGMYEDYLFATEQEAQDKLKEIQGNE